jgi:hypothetical protein
MAGDDRVMRPASLLMLHNASMFSAGDANAHRKVAEDLDVITELSKTAYLSHATEALTPEKLTEIMDAETWVTPEQALEWGLATEIDKPAAEDEPTQSARVLVVDALVNPKRVPIAQVSFTQEQMDEIASRVRDELVTELGFVPGEPDQLAEPEEESPYARYARIFEKLSNM